jgi:hypothetical protein
MGTPLDAAEHATRPWKVGGAWVFESRTDCESPTMPPMKSGVLKPLVPPGMAAEALDPPEAPARSFRSRGRASDTAAVAWIALQYGAPPDALRPRLQGMQMAT